MRLTKHSQRNFIGFIIMIKNALLFTFIFLLIAACSSKEAYETLQTDRFDCEKKPVQQREECYKHVDNLLTYDDYKKEREKL